MTFSWANFLPRGDIIPNKHTGTICRRQKALYSSVFGWDAVDPFGSYYIGYTWSSNLDNWLFVTDMVAMAAMIPSRFDTLHVQFVFRGGR